MKLDKLIPIGTKVVVEVEKLDEKSKGGIYLPEDTRRQDQDRVTKGKMFMMGPLAFVDLVDSSESLVEQMPSIGDTVFFVKYAGKELSLEDREFRVIHDEDIYAFESRALD